MAGRRILLILGVILTAVILTLVSVYAGDENSTDGDPSDNNACYPGGDWDDGRCVDDWWWNAGWYRQAVIEDRITADQVPDFYKGGVQEFQQSNIPQPATTDEP